jgi:hypothetical protein
MADDDTSLIEANSTVLEDIEDSSIIEDTGISSIVNYISHKYALAKDYRKTDEQRWLRAYTNYRGLYGSDVQFTEAEKSRIFIKVTKTKTLAAYGQVVDVLFAGQKFPLSIEPTSLPEGIADTVSFDPKKPEQLKELENPYGNREDEGLPPGATLTSLELGPLEEKLEGMPIEKGVGKTPTAATFSPAMVAAKKMEKKIMDQLEESNASKHLRSTAFEMALFGTGILKGPFATNKEYPKWEEDGSYAPVFKIMPQISHVSIWNMYPDPDANNMDEVQYIIERHKLSRTQLRALKKRPFFRDKVIEECIGMGESYIKESWEDGLADYEIQHSVDRFEVVEYWGVLDKDLIDLEDLDMPEEFEDMDELQANVWVCNDKVIRLVLNPFKPVRIPYMAVPYELNPYSFFGVGIAENMDDTQTLMNGFMRMAVDNAVLSGNLIVEIDETNLVPGQDLSLYPGKVFRRQGGAPGQAIFGTKFPNVSNENMQLFDKARQLSDESTGFPSFAHGQTGVTGTGRTASGISMLMNAASGAVKSVIKNVDDYLLRPLGQGFFQFNMQFDFDPEIKGDLEVKARGVESLMANEVRSQRLMQFLGVASNPTLAPFAKFHYVIAEIAKSLGLDPEKVTNSMEEAAIQAELLKQFQATQPQPQPQQQVPAGINPQDTAGTGDGTIGTGQAPAPQEQGFTGNAQPQGPQGTPNETPAPAEQSPPMATLQ